MAKIKNIGVAFRFDCSGFMASLRRLRAAMVGISLVQQRFNDSAWSAVIALVLTTMGGRLRTFRLPAGFGLGVMVVVTLPWWRAVPRYLPAEDKAKIERLLPCNTSLSISYGWPEGWWRWSYWRRLMGWRHPLQIDGLPDE
jgi:hypothetical protein